MPLHVVVAPDVGLLGARTVAFRSLAAARQGGSGGDSGSGGGGGGGVVGGIARAVSGWAKSQG